MLLGRRLLLLLKPHNQHLNRLTGNTNSHTTSKPTPAAVSTQPQHHTSVATMRLHVTLKFDLLISGSTLTEPPQLCVRGLSLAWIARAVFLSERGHTDTHTKS